MEKDEEEIPSPTSIKDLNLEQNAIPLITGFAMRLERIFAGTGAVSAR